MSSLDSESDLEYSDRDLDRSDSDDEDQIGAVASVFEPYINEPLVPNDEGIGGDGQAVADASTDVDGLSRQELERRYEGVDPLGTWCLCSNCNVEYLIGSREFRCCHEVAEAYGKVVFDGMIERYTCITQHEDFVALVNKTNLKMVAQLLKDRQGKNYKKKPRQPENEFLRAVAYRWVARWFYGYLGWDNTRPLPACVYMFLRRKYHTQHSKGYATTDERD